MKILKIITSIFAAVILFFALGMVKPSFEYTSQITVAASVQKSWNVYQDTAKRKQWLPGFKSLTLKSGNWMQPGSMYEMKLVQDEVYVMSEALKELKEPEIISYELFNEVMKSEYEYTFQPANGGTLIQTHYKVTGHNLMWRSVLFLSKSYLTSASDMQLQSLKKVIEDN